MQVAFFIPVHSRLLRRRRLNLCKGGTPFRMAKDIWADAENTDEKQLHQNSMIFPIGAPNDGFAQYFSGQSYLAPVSTAQVKIFNVTFEPGCRKLDYVA